jgi:uncharacterized protein
MKTLADVRAAIRQNAQVLAEKYGIAVVGIFGSYVRGEQKPESDLDLLVEIVEPISLLELTGAELYLTEALDTKVDLVPRRSIRKELRETILGEAVAV